MDCCFSSSRNTVAYREMMEMEGLPQFDSLSYGGKFNENYFDIMSRETKRTLSVDVGNACFKNPITDKLENFIGLLAKSKYDGVGRRNCPLDIVIALDVSGSMSNGLGRSNNSCLSLAKTALVKLIDKINPEDRIGLLTFDTSTYEIISLQNIKDENSKQSLKDLISPIHTQGGTELFPALQKAYEMIKQGSNSISKDQFREKRIVFLTDMGDISNEGNFFNLVESMAKEKIYLTIVGIGFNFNEKTTFMISKNQGANFFCATEENHLNEFLVDDFDNIFFPTGFNGIMQFSSVNYDIANSYGSDYAPKKTSVKTEWSTETHHQYDVRMRKTIYFLMMLYKRKNNRVPKPILANLANYMNCGYSTLNEMSSLCPSNIKVDQETIQSKGGLLLLKLRDTRKRTVNQDKVHDTCTVSFTYNEYTGENCKYNLSYSYTANQGHYFSSNTMKKGIALYLGMSYLRHLLSAENKKNQPEVDSLISNKEKVLNFIKSLSPGSVHEDYSKEFSQLIGKITKNQETKKKYEGRDPNEELENDQYIF